MEPPHYPGHRKRPRERFLKNRLAGFAEHEVIELLLILDVPRSRRQLMAFAWCVVMGESRQG